MNVTSKKHESVDHLTTAIACAASEVGVRLYNLRPSGKGVAFQLKTGEPNEKRVDWRGKLKWQARYQRLSRRENVSIARGTAGVTYNSVVPGAVCWHGHRDFLRALYARVPDAKVRTAFITYQGREHFEDNYQRTWDGPVTRPTTFAYANQAKPYIDACTCDEGGI